MRVHSFTSESDAIIAIAMLTIEDGDVVIVNDEKVVGFVVGPWIVAVTSSLGAHCSSVDDLYTEEYAGSIRECTQVARDMGFGCDYTLV